jgi:dTDP-4-dehydrorhamnose 3,5-epimerase
MIQDLHVRKLNFIPDEWGYVIELMRDDWEEFKKVGQVYATGILPGKKRPIGGWHYHLRQTDSVLCLQGLVKVVLYDRRKDSPTYGQIEEHVIGAMNPLLITIPPGVVHAFEALGTEVALMFNVPDAAFDWENPDEYKIPFDSGEIPYAW